MVQTLEKEKASIISHCKQLQRYAFEFSIFTLFHLFSSSFIEGEFLVKFQLEIYSNFCSQLEDIHKGDAVSTIGQTRSEFPALTTEESLKSRFSRSFPVLFFLPYIYFLILKL